MDHGTREEDEGTTGPGGAACGQSVGRGSTGAGWTGGGAEDGGTKGIGRIGDQEFGTRDREEEVKRSRGLANWLVARAKGNGKGAGLGFVPSWPHEPNKPPSGQDVAQLELEK